VYNDIRVKEEHNEREVIKMTAQERENTINIINEMVANGYHLGQYDLEWYIQLGQAQWERFRENFYRVKGLS